MEGGELSFFIEEVKVNQRILNRCLLQMDEIVSKNGGFLSVSDGSYFLAELQVFKRHEERLENTLMVNNPCLPKSDAYRFYFVVNTTR